MAHPTRLEVPRSSPVLARAGVFGRHSHRLPFLSRPPGFDLAPLRRLRSGQSGSRASLPASPPTRAGRDCDGCTAASSRSSASVMGVMVPGKSPTQAKIGLEWGTQHGWGGPPAELNYGKGLAGNVRGVPHLVPGNRYVVRRAFERASSIS